MWSDPIYDQINYVKMRNGIWRFRLQVVSIDQVRSALIHPLKATGRFTGMTYKTTTSRALLQSFASHGDHFLDGWTTVLGISRWSHPTIAKVSYGFRRLIDVEQRVCCLVQERSWIYPIRQTTFVGSYSVSVGGFGSNVLRSSVISKKENRNTKKSTQKHPVYMYIYIYIVIISYIYILTWRDTDSWHFMRTFLFKALHLLPPTPQNGERGTSGSVWKLTPGVECGGLMSQIPYSICLSSLQDDYIFMYMCIYIYLFIYLYQWWLLWCLNMKV